VNWHLITGEYPPQPGGVSDYTRLVAGALAEVGERVTVWCPPADEATPGDRGVTVRRELGAIGRADLRRFGALLDAELAPRRLLVQWVPHAFGRRAINYPFCRWVRRRVAGGDRVEIVVHEPFLDFRCSWKQWAAAAVQRLMMRTLLERAARAWVTIPTWEGLIRPLAPAGLPIASLPVPSTIPVVSREAETAAIRERHLKEAEYLVGHFGTYGAHVAAPLAEALARLLADLPSATILLLGRNGERFRDKLLTQYPELARRVAAPGAQSAEELSAHLAACDLFVQPYVGGISARNTSLMACLAHGRAVIATAGRLTEPFWAESAAVALVPEHDSSRLCAAAAGLLADPEARRRLGAAAAELYAERFSIGRLVQRLTAPESQPGTLDFAEASAHTDAHPGRE
jgi:glycosyltransferase involved in cell wall biosynthesis